jgi:hypothetical protein
MRLGLRDDLEHFDGLQQLGLFAGCQSIHDHWHMPTPARDGCLPPSCAILGVLDNQQSNGLRPDAQLFCRNPFFSTLPTGMS